MGVKRTRRTQRLRRAWVASGMPPAVATPRVMTRTAGALYLAGAATAGVVAHLLAGDQGSARGVGALAAVAAVVGLALLVSPRPLPRGAFHVVVGAGTALVTLSVQLTGGGAASVALAGLYLFIACDAFLFFAWRGAVLHLAAAVGCALLAVPDDVGMRHPGVAVACVVLVSGALVGRVVRLAEAAEVDSLTGLANRRGLDRVVQVALARAERGGAPLSVALLDLDHFKRVNDTGGHAAGDELLLQVTAAWRRLLRPEDVLARLGGDEFVLLLPGAGEEDAAAVVERCRVVTPGRACSAGVTAWRPGDSLSLLLGRADTALYQAKAGGRGRTVVEGGCTAALARELAQALQDGAVQVHYQPVVDLRRGGEVAGVEALARWTSATRGPVSPAEFVQVAEDHGLVERLGRHVLRRAAADAWALQAAAGRPLRLAVNVSGRQLVPAFPALVDQVLAETGWPADQLVLEITESVLDADSDEALAVVAALRARGILTAIDDFGTGYSTLSRLDAMPCDVLKLDQSFVARMRAGDGPPALLDAISAMARALGLAVVAEGVETAEQASALTRLGYAMGQGHLFSAALPRDAAAELLAAHRRLGGTGPVPEQRPAPAAERPVGVAAARCRRTGSSQATSGMRTGRTETLQP